MGRRGCQPAASHLLIRGVGDQYADTHCTPHAAPPGFLAFDATQVQL
jgi:hypothetical protein